MTYKQIEAAREARLWIGQVIVPAAIAAVTLSANPQVREYVGTKVEKIKKTIQEKKLKRKLKSWEQ